MTPAETIKRLEAVRVEIDSLGAVNRISAKKCDRMLTAIESALADLRENQSAREKLAREAADTAASMDCAMGCGVGHEVKAAILKHFNLEAK